ncbi:hypothetical protein [Streptomyces sp. NPDC001381]|uniref:hypothetical protein n=1 Tax=Streptomyces sp. NPDC001381 TaxID=3364567 RepID=UPI0036C97899
MRKLHKAGVVAAMIGSLAMAGAGAASASPYGSDGDGGFRQCIQQGDVTVGLLNVSDVNLAGLLPTAFLAPSAVSKQTVTQQSCSNGDDSPNVNVAHVTDDSPFGG